LDIAKINIDTHLRLAFTAMVREVLANSPKEIDPRKILGPAKDAMKEVAKSQDAAVRKLRKSLGKLVVSLSRFPN
jgi:fructose/tagatose bisphosphate aldolase